MGVCTDRGADGRAGRGCTQWGRGGGSGGKVDLQLWREEYRKVLYGLRYPQRSSCGGYPGRCGQLDLLLRSDQYGKILRSLREFPDDAKRDAGYQLDRVQHGLQPEDFKPMPTIGKGVEEIRVRDDTGAYRVIYTARLADAVYVLHAFQKKTHTSLIRYSRILFSGSLFTCPVCPEPEIKKESSFSYSERR